jgi:signal transduction histidine kinase
LVRLVAAAAQNTGGRITLADARQSVVYSSDPAIPLYRTDNTIEFPPDGQVRRAIRQDEWTQAERLFVTLPLFKDGQTLSGYVQLSVPTAPLYARIHQTWINLLVAGLVVLLLTTLVSLGMAHFILRPIQALTRGTGAIAAGDLTQQVTPAGPDEVRRLAVAFNRMVGQVREMLSHQEAFVAHAVHELRTPLTSLRLRLEVLQTHGQSDPDLARHYLAQMEEEIAHLSRLVDHLLALATLDARALPPPVPFDVAPLLYALADEMGAQAQQAGLTLRVDVPAHLPFIAANAGPLRAALRNLLDNAIHYTLAGGQVTLSAVGEAHEVQIAVADSGIGIPPEAIGHVFERFYRVDKARSRRLGSAGLGLPLAKGIVETYGGRVEVQSIVGRGSVFTVHLPLVRAA